MLLRRGGQLAAQERFQAGIARARAHVVREQLLLPLLRELSEEVGIETVETADFGLGQGGYGDGHFHGNEEERGNKNPAPVTERGECPYDQALRIIASTDKRPAP